MSRLNDCNVIKENMFIIFSFHIEFEIFDNNTLYTNLFKNRIHKLIYNKYTV